MSRIQHLISLFTDFRIGNDDPDLTFPEFIQKIGSALDTDMEDFSTHSSFEYASMVFSIKVDQDWSKRNRFTLEVHNKEPHKVPESDILKVEFEPDSITEPVIGRSFIGDNWPTVSNT